MMNFNKERMWVQMHNLPLACMNEVRGRLIGESIGSVEEVDVKEDGSGWSSFFRSALKWI